MNTSHATGWGKDSPTPAQIKELFAQIETGKVNKRNLQAFLRNGAAFENQDLARDILGRDFISPDEVAEARGLSYSKEQLKKLEETVPSRKVLKELRENNMALMPAPPEPLHMLAVRDLNSKLFYSSTEGWYSNKEERKAFSETDKTSFGWLAIGKEELPDSPRKNFDEQSKLVPKNMRIPNAPEFAWFLTTYKEVRNIYLFEDMWARTSSTDSDGHHVYLDFSERGLRVYSRWDVVRDSCLGLADAWKFRTD